MKKVILLLALFVSSVSAFGQSIGRPSAILDGRTYLGTLPQAVSKNPESGVVVVTIWVDPYGNVTKAEAGAEGTKTNSDDLWNAAREAALKTRFNQKSDAPALQKGSMIYLFSDVFRTAAFPGLKTESVDYIDLKEDVDETALKFLGIPIDGSQAFIVSQLIEKGFVESRREEFLEGQFNGEPVKIFVHTYHDKVDRIIVEFDEVPEMDLREQYNKLLAQLSANAKYKPLQENQPIPSEELFYFSNTDHKCRFGILDDTGDVYGEVWFMITNRAGYRVTLYYDNLKNRPHGEDL